MRISDWSSDVCSSDLTVEPDDKAATAAVDAPRAPVSASGYEPPVPQADSNTAVETPADHPTSPAPEPENVPTPPGDRKSGGEGKSVSVRVDLGGRRTIKKTKQKKSENT